MLRDYRWRTLYKGFTISQKNNGWYYAEAHTYDQIKNTNLKELKKTINKINIMTKDKIIKMYQTFLTILFVFGWVSVVIHIININ